GRAFPGNLNLTCNNWTSSTFGSAMLGHVDREGIADTVYQKSWVSSHMSRSCSQPDLVATGGAGLYYCFAQYRQDPIRPGSCGAVKASSGPRGMIPRGVMCLWLP